MHEIGLASSLLTPLTPISDAELDCPACLTAIGRLCHRHEREVLPQLAINVGWLKLIGNARTEQTRRQHIEKLTPKERADVAKAGRRNARRVARSKRGGYFGLAKAIQRG